MIATGVDAFTADKLASATSTPASLSAVSLLIAKAGAATTGGSSRKRAMAGPSAVRNMRAPHWIAFGLRRSHAVPKSEGTQQRVP